MCLVELGDTRVRIDDDPKFCSHTELHLTWDK